MKEKLEADLYRKVKIVFYFVDQYDNENLCTREQRTQRILADQEKLVLREEFCAS